MALALGLILLWQMGDSDAPDANEVVGVVDEDLVTEVVPGLVTILDTFEVPEGADELVSGADLTTYASERTLAEEGEIVLRGFEERGGCAVVQSGYLDLSGKVWGCVVLGDGWVDVCFVQATDDDTSVVAVLHMDADDVGAAVG